MVFATLFPSFILFFSSEHNSDGWRIRLFLGKTIDTGIGRAFYMDRSATEGLKGANHRQRGRGTCS